MPSSPRMVMFEGYEVYADGRVYRPEQNRTRADGVTRRMRGGWVATRIRKGGIGVGGGYAYIDLWIRQTAKTWLLHRLIAVCFLPNPDGKPEVNHKNGVRHECHVGNLEWATKKENQQHAMEHIHKHYGSNAVRAKLSPEQVESLRYKRNILGHKLLALAKEYNIAFQTVSAISKGAHYAKQPGL